MFPSVSLSHSKLVSLCAGARDGLRPRGPGAGGADGQDGEGQIRGRGHAGEQRGSDASGQPAEHVQFSHRDNLPRQYPVPLLGEK